MVATPPHPAPREGGAGAGAPVPLALTASFRGIGWGGVSSAALWGAAASRHRAFVLRIMPGSNRPVMPLRASIPAPSAVPAVLRAPRTCFGGGVTTPAPPYPPTGGKPSHQPPPTRLPPRRAAHAQRSVLHQCRLFRVPLFAGCPGAVLGGARARHPFFLWRFRTKNQTPRRAPRALHPKKRSWHEN